MEDLEKVSLKIFKAIFEGKEAVEIENADFTIDQFSRGIKYVDYMGYRFIEQNRYKPSEWGKKAKEGHKIMWVLKGRRYIARIMDGNYILLGKSK